MEINQYRLASRFGLLNGVDVGRMVDPVNLVGFAHFYASIHGG